jgi:hypothetical protein
MNSVQEKKFTRSEIQFDFSGGMNSFNDDHRIAPDEYGDAFNVRNREGTLDAISAPLQDTDAPAGYKQGLYAYGNYLVLFNNGRAYIKDATIVGADWNYVVGFKLNESAERIYAQMVPASVINQERKLISASQIEGDSNNPAVYKTTAIVNGTVASLVCQDGNGQPYLILSDGSARRANTYDEWELSDREYVPIGRQMAYMNGILFIVSADGKRLYRSVSGRPCDFVVNIDITGNKGGDASTTAYAVSANETTGLFPLKTGELLVSTDDGIFPIDFNYDRQIFGEPTFKNVKFISVGVVNQFSFVDLVKDYAFVDIDGIRSYVASASDNNEGRNSLFSQRISKLLLNIKQTEAYSCAYVYDNLAFFAVETAYGNNVLVYDMISERWISIDTYGIGNIKQFACVSKATKPLLYCITDSGVYQLFGSDESLTSTVHFRSIVQDDAKEELRLTNIRAVFLESTAEDEVTATVITNGRGGRNAVKTLSDTFTGILYPARYRVLYADTDQADNLNFTFQHLSKIGWKVGPLLSWASNAKLAAVQVDAEVVNYNTSINRQTKVYAS